MFHTIHKIWMQWIYFVVFYYVYTSHLLDFATAGDHDAEMDLYL